MGKTEIIAELPHMKPEERKQVFDRLCELQEVDLLRGAGPSPEEKKILDHALAEYLRDGQTGTPWREVMDRIRGARTA